MKNEDLFKYQEEAMTLLTKAYKKQKFAHAYLLDGENGTGITDAAIYMAKQLICKNINTINNQINTSNKTKILRITHPTKQQQIRSNKTNKKLKNNS